MRPQASARLGVSVGRKIGGAVQRNKVKRAIREAFWSSSPELPGGHDYVIVARPGVEGLVERDGTEASRRRSPSWSTASQADQPERRSVCRETVPERASCSR